MEENNRSIYLQRKDGLFVVKFFRQKHEYYVGAFKDINVARVERDRAYLKLKCGDLSGIKVRESVKRKVFSEEQWYKQYLEYPLYMDTPQYKLRYAVLISALRDFCDTARIGKYTKAQHWIMESSHPDDTFSFVNVCELFHLSPAAVRKQLNGLNQKQKQALKSYTIFN